jgi:hypothetical protein
MDNNEDHPFLCQGSRDYCVCYPNYMLSYSKLTKWENIGYNMNYMKVFEWARDDLSP